MVTESEDCASHVVERNLLRAVTPLVLEITIDGIVASSPRLPKRLRVSAHAARMLVDAQAGNLAVEQGDRPDADRRRAIVSALQEAGFLVDAATPEPSAESPWSDWGPVAWEFHSRVRDTRFLSPEPAAIDSHVRRLQERAMPSIVRRNPESRILLLPRVHSPLELSYREVLQSRRTHRDFMPHELDIDVLSDVLHYCFGPQRFVDAGVLGVMQFKAYASAGARHELEAFVVVLTVKGVLPGLYYYDPIQHGLVLVRAGVGEAELEHLTNDQEFFSAASFGVVTAAVGERMSWKYPHPVAYKMLLINVGTMAQLFSMTTTALGLGAAMTGAIRDTAADELLGLKQPSEFTTFAMACGLPRRGSDGMPWRVQNATAPHRVGAPIPGVESESEGGPGLGQPA